MNWNDVGGWLKDNATTGAALVGSLLTGNVPGAVAAGVALVSSATGQTDPGKVLGALQGDPETMLKLRELALKESDSIRQHIQAMEEARLKDAQAEHAEQQETIRGGDQSGDEYVRRTRPMMARQSWYSAVAYVVGFELLKAAGVQTSASLDLAMLLMAPAGAYLGFRSLDKFTGAKAAKP
jgi:hypothetical protein